VNAPAPQPSPISGPRLVRDADPGASPPRDAIAGWLRVLDSLLELPARERQAIRDELGEHLRERTRDLILGGRSEPDAVGAAIGELGDAAALARRFHQASHAPRRRLLMHTAILGLAGAAMITSVFALRSSGPSATMTTFQPPEARAAATSQRVTLNHDSNWESFFQAAGSAAGTPVYIHWSHLRELEGPSGPLEPDQPIGVEADNFSLARALELINDQLNLPRDNGIDSRVIDGRLEFATVAYFDQREAALATFDLAPIINARRAAQDDVPAASVLEEAASVIHALVHPDMWKENGGDRATLTTFDTRLFIRAPRRIMPEIEWVIGEMGKGPGVAPAGAAATAPPGGR